MNLNRLTQRVNCGELKPPILGLATIHIDKHHPVVRTPHVQAVVGRLPYDIGRPGRRGACNYPSKMCAGNSHPPKRGACNLCPSKMCALWTLVVVPIAGATRSGLFGSYGCSPCSGSGSGPQSSMVSPLHRNSSK